MTKYLIDEKAVDEKKFWESLNEEIENDVDENLDEYIDEENKEIHIGSLTYLASQVLEATDPIAYRCYASDLANMFYEDDKYDLERGDEVTMSEHVYRIEETDED